MELKQVALAGTVESSDIQITLSPNKDGIRIDLSSPVKDLYGDKIIKVIKDTLKANKIDNAEVRAIDKGALDCVIKARMQTAIQRSLGIDEPNWEVL